MLEGCNVNVHGAWRRGISTRLLLRSSTSGEFKVFGVWGTGTKEGRVRVQQRDSVYCVMTTFISTVSDEKTEEKVPVMINRKASKFSCTGSGFTEMWRTEKVTNSLHFYADMTAKGAGGGGEGSLVD
jgi:hypothetical protein